MTNSRKRLLICSPGIPHEFHGGSSILFYSYIERLKRTDFKVLNLLLLQPNNYTEQALTEYTAKMSEPGRFEILPCQVDDSIIRGRFSIKLNTLPLNIVLRQAQEFQPDVVFCLDFLSAWVCEQITSSVKLVWLGDLNFQTRWYHAWYSARENLTDTVNLLTVLRHSRSLVATWIRSLVWKKIYRDVLQKVDSVIVSSKSSEKHLRRLGVVSTYQPYPWPNNQRSDNISQVKRYAIPSFLFYGNLVGLGSRSALHFMFEKLYPRLLRLWGQNGFQIFIAGRIPPTEWVQKEITARPELEYLGFVDDLDSLMASCHAVIVPIDVPVGNRSRIVSAMAKGSLVIAHKNASLGNPDLRDGVTCYLASNADQFVAYMQKAFDRPKQIEDIIVNAKHCYNHRFHPDVATEMLVKEISRVMEQKSACSLA